MRKTIGLNPDNSLEQYALDILQAAPPRRRGNLVARALYNYFGGRTMTSEELAVLLTGTVPSKPSSKTKSKVVKNQKSSNDQKQVDKISTEVRDPSNVAAQHIPESESQSGLEDVKSDYQFTDADTAMLGNIMAQFQNM